MTEKYFGVMDMFRVKFNHEEGAILRMIGLIERRQFTITGMVVRCSGEDSEATFRTTMRFFDHPSYEQHPPITFHQLKSLFFAIEKMQCVSKVEYIPTEATNYVQNT